MDGKKIVEQLEKDNVNPKTIKPLSPAEQKEFLDKLNLNVPEDERKLYEQLILQNQHRDKHQFYRAQRKDSLPFLGLTSV